MAHARTARPGRLVNVAEHPAAPARLPYPVDGNFMDITENTGSGQFNALQFELQRRFKAGLAVNAAYTLAGSDSNAPDSGNRTTRVRQSAPIHPVTAPGPDPDCVSPTGVK